MTRRPRLLLGGLAAVVIAGTLVAPIVISSGGSGPCSTSLIFSGRQYAARSIGHSAAVEDVSVGVGITRGCGTMPQNVNVRSLDGVKPTAAVALEGVPSVVYVRRGVCPKDGAGTLWACLTR